MGTRFNQCLLSIKLSERCFFECIVSYIGSMILRTVFCRYFVTDLSSHRLIALAYKPVIFFVTLYKVLRIIVIIPRWNYPSLF